MTLTIASKNGFKKITSTLIKSAEDGSLEKFPGNKEEQRQTVLYFSFTLKTVPDCLSELLTLLLYFQGMKTICVLLKARS